MKIFNLIQKYWSNLSHKHPAILGVKRYKAMHRKHNVSVYNTRFHLKFLYCIIHGHVLEGIKQKFQYLIYKYVLINVTMLNENFMVTSKG